MSRISRRKLLGGLAGGGGALLLSGCDVISRSDTFGNIARGNDRLHQESQRLLTARTALVREYSAADISPNFRANGNQMPNAMEYLRLMEQNFASWRLRIDGLVARPLSLSLAQLNVLAQRSQITRHDCVEGWSAIGQWQGPQLGRILQMAGLADKARYLIFHCADDFSGTPYYESIDRIDAFHPQTILATQMNGEALPVKHGAPVRLRVERKLGYKHAKYVMRIEAVQSLAQMGAGKGGYWEDVGAYDWYAGI